MIHLYKKTLCLISYECCLKISILWNLTIFNKLSSKLVNQTEIWNTISILFSNRKKNNKKTRACMYLVCILIYNIVTIKIYISLQWLSSWDQCFLLYQNIKSIWTLFTTKREAEPIWTKYLTFKVFFSYSNSSTLE
jgi:hypothetical protein